MPEHISASQARLFENCPKAYAYRYVTHLDLAAETDENRDFGRAVHAGLAAGYKLLLGATEPLTLDERNVVREASVEALEERWFLEGLDVGEAYDEAHEHVLGEWDGEDEPGSRSNVFESIPRLWRVLGVELGFRETLTLVVVPRDYGDDVIELKVTGVIDLMLGRRDMPIIRLIDHKTGARLLTLDEMRNDDQLGLYGAVIAKRSPEHEILIGHNRTGQPKRDRLQLARFDAMGEAHIIAKLHRTRVRIDRAAERNEFGARPGRQCGWCDYRSACPGALVLEYAEVSHDG